MTQGLPPSDDDRTAIWHPPESRLRSVLPEHGPKKSSTFADHSLPEGTLIQDFEITGVIGEGGFGIVYRAYDVALQREVAIKEYMPTSLAVRGNASFEVSVRSERHRATFEAGLKSFVNEARLLARFDHPALVKVFRFWEANRTAYMAMPYYEGPTLKAALAEMGRPPPEELLRSWLHSLLDALSVLHREQCYHRDIAPDNILLTASGPLLLDFGAARRVITDMAQTLTVVLKAGYAPVEQYGDDMVQGPWTDLYALAGVVHYAITGRRPTASVERVVTDALPPLAMTHAGQYSDGFLRAIDAALAVRPEARPQDATRFRELLDAGLPPKSLKVEAPYQAAPLEDSTHRVPRHSPASPAPAARGSRKVIYATAVIGMLAAGGTVWWLTERNAQAPMALRTPASAPVESPSPNSTTPAPETARPPDAASVEDPPPTLESPPTQASIPEATQVQPRKPAPDGNTPRDQDHSKLANATRPAKENRRLTEVDRDAAHPKNYGDRPARCSDILQKASLESLSAEETAYLKKECR